MAAGYIAMPEGSKAPAPTRRTMLAVAKSLGDMATDAAKEVADVAVGAAKTAADEIKKMADRLQKS